MQLTLVDLFVNKLHDYLQKENLSFKKINYTHTYEFSLCSIKEKNSIVIDKQFLQDNIDEIFSIVAYSNLVKSSVIFHELLIEYPDIVFNNLLTLPITRYEHTTLNDKNTALNRVFPNLSCIFSEVDLITYLINYNEKGLKCRTVYEFKDLLSILHNKFNNHPDYHAILLNNFNVNRSLIRKTNNTIIKIRSWVIKNIEDSSFLEEFLYLENEKSLFFNVNSHTMLKFLDISAVQSNYLIKNAKGVDSYHILLKYLTNMLNNHFVKESLYLERVEGNFAFDKQKYQLTFLSKQALHSEMIENTIDLLLKAICDYYNLGDKKPEDGNNTVLKIFQYYNLNDKLSIKNNKTGKVQKI